MFRALLVLTLTALVAGCATTGSVDEAVPAPPAYRYSFVVDGRLTRTLDLPAGTQRVSVVFQPRNGESAIWQVYESTYAHVVLEPREREITARGGRKVRIDGEVAFYRDLKLETRNGQDHVVRGKPVKRIDVERADLVLEPGVPAMIELAEGLHLEIAVLPPSM